ncbi:Spy/CpxP family protein refolding chaperone [Sedimenticola sp.]|uniref:Spy/CpxP family protein refolding chaperone n=1 Tax=Sedimenticola sp. TaxID=1940285 RepID=UPI003D0EB6E8
MKRSNKILVTLVAVAGIGLVTLSQVSANDRYDRCGFGAGDSSMRYGGDEDRGRHGFGGDKSGDRTARMEQGLDMMKYKLRITESQEPAWQAFEQSMKQKMANRLERRQAMREGKEMTVSERVEAMRSGAAQMTEAADAIEQLYASLTPEQQKIADEMRPMGGMPRMR